MTQKPSDRVTALGDSPFNRPWSNIGPENFLHFYQQLDNVLAQSPRRVLEVGPGDHTVTDFLRRKGVEVDTVDFDAELHPDFVRDLRQPLDLPRVYDVVLAAEVLEHMPFRWFDTAVANLAGAARPGGRIVISLPYSTLKLFPKDKRWGRFVSSAGRIRTGIPLGPLAPALSVLGFLYRLAQGKAPRQAWRRYGLLPASEDRADVHHWDLGYAPTARSVVRVRLSRTYRLRSERVYEDTNSVIFVLDVP